MSDRYVLILVLYSLATFAAILALAEIILSALHRPILRLIDRLRPNDGVLAHLVLRLLPALLALALTAFSAIPGYFRGEPVSTREIPGALLVGLALLGIYSILWPLTKAIALAIRTSLKTRRWSKQALATEVFSDFPLLEIELGTPVIVASGLIRRSIFLSNPVRSLLSARELRAALRHEVAHCRQHHNLAKLLCLVAPHFLPSSTMDESLREVIEFAADDEACSMPGDALNLASAVVILARESVTNPTEMLYTALADERYVATLKRRVERLVLPPSSHGRSIFIQLTAGCFAVLALASVVGSLPVAQHAFRETLELLVR